MSEKPALKPDVNALADLARYDVGPGLANVFSIGQGSVPGSESATTFTINPLP